ncbi:hypothetical protein OIDMADRAFT_39592 [Oidiodendron maius Zn]|uniref:Major facilitator superfamily (MFS) profile domain-containing protein n=1 Tax=Oidiodendron maius (strain Zn) TaxID=913774 RepID=A0A0C3DT64_OIDMZ|nr:hypothetical protein OIDMADRAFT_39592 [Oidiodendron maius Zn]
MTSSEENKEAPPQESGGVTQPPYSISSGAEKVFYAWVASMAAFSSPVSSSIYYPALTVLASDLNTSVGNINLTITTYMIFQAVAPTFIGGISDRWGRRPAYLFCFTLYIAANTGLAIQTSFVALILLRCLQSSGSSGTIRTGKYIGIAALGSNLGPILGPLIGGLLIHFQGWRAVFWFLDIYGGVMLLTFALIIPETCRNIVGNGSVPPQRWNISLISYLHRRKQRKAGLPELTTTISRKFRPSIISSLYIIFSKEAFLLMFLGGLLYAGFYILLTSLPSQLVSTFHYNSIQVGLCYIPMGAGALVACQVVGRLIDWNFRRHAKNLNVEVRKDHQVNIDEFTVERARLEIGLPLVYLGCVCIIPYGWIMNMEHPPLPAALVLLFLNTVSLSGSFQYLNVLIIDCYPDSPSAATAANNLIRCLLWGWRSGPRWTGTLISFIWAFGSLLWWSAWILGQRWRKEKKRKSDERRANRGRPAISAAS